MAEKRHGASESKEEVMPRYVVYLSSQRLYFATLEVEAEDEELACQAALYQCKHSDWAPEDDLIDIQVEGCRQVR